MAEQMMLIPGRSSKQGTSLNAGKLKEEYQAVTSTIEMNESTMRKLGLSAGDRVRLSCATGKVEVECGKPRKDEDLPDGMIFIPYGPSSSELMEKATTGREGRDRHADVEADDGGRGMPGSQMKTLPCLLRP